MRAHFQQTTVMPRRRIGSSLGALETGPQNNFTSLAMNRNHSFSSITGIVDSKQPPSQLLVATNAVVMLRRDLELLVGRAIKGKALIPRQFTSRRLDRFALMKLVSFIQGLEAKLNIGSGRKSGGAYYSNSDNPVISSSIHRLQRGYLRCICSLCAEFLP